MRAPAIWASLPLPLHLVSTTSSYIFLTSVLNSYVVTLKSYANGRYCPVSRVISITLSVFSFAMHALTLEDLRVYSRTLQ